SAAATALVRLVAPFSEIAWPRQHVLAFRDMPKQLTVGQTFEAELVDTAGNIPGDLRIEYNGNAADHRDAYSEPPARVGERALARRENVRQSFAVRATGGDDNTMPWHWVEVNQLPELQSLVVDVHPPAYSGLPETRAEPHLDVLAGSSIEITGTTNQPIRSARVLQDNEPPLEATVSDDPQYAGHSIFHIESNKWLPTHGGSYRLEVETETNVTGVVGQWNLSVTPDAPPSVAWQQPSDDLFILPRAVVPIQVLAKDDLAIRQIQIEYDRTDKS